MFNYLMKILEDRVTHCGEDPLLCGACNEVKHTADVLCMKDSCAVVCKECLDTLCTPGTAVSALMREQAPPLHADAR